MKPYAIASGLILLATFAAGVLLIGLVPNPNPGGHAASVAILFFMPFMGTLFWLLFLVMPFVPPLGAGLRKSGAYGTIMVAFTSTMAVSFCVTAASVLHRPWPGPNLLYIVMGFFFVVIGNITPKLPRNHFAGIRTPWALADDEIWDQTQRFGGWTTVIAGLLILNAAILFTPQIANRVMLGSLVVTAALSMIASWRFARQKRARLAREK